MSYKLYVEMLLSLVVNFIAIAKVLDSPNYVSDGTVILSGEGNFVSQPEDVKSDGGFFLFDEIARLQI